MRQRKSVVARKLVYELTKEILLDVESRGGGLDDLCRSNRLIADAATLARCAGQFVLDSHLSILLCFEVMRSHQLEDPRAVP